MLWVDYHRPDARGLTHGNVRNATPGTKQPFVDPFSPAKKFVEERHAPVLKVMTLGRQLDARPRLARTAAVDRLVARCRRAAPNALRWSQRWAVFPFCAGLVGP